MLLSHNDPEISVSQQRSTLNQMPDAFSRGRDADPSSTRVVAVNNDYFWSQHDPLHAEGEPDEFH